MNYRDANHPLWVLLRVLCKVVVLAVLLAVTSDRFDKEWIVLITYSLMDGGIESRGPWRKFTRREGD